MAILDGWGPREDVIALGTSQVEHLHALVGACSLVLTPAHLRFLEAGGDSTALACMFSGRCALLCIGPWSPNGKLLAPGSGDKTKPAVGWTMRAADKTMPAAGID